MVKAVALLRGYFGGVIREPGGEPFEVPDEIWKDEKRRPKWARLASASDVEDDGDGGEAETKTADKPQARGGKRGRKPAETVEAASAEPFADNGGPENVKGNGVVEALGGPAPDWIAPGTPHTPVMAED